MAIMTITEKKIRNLFGAIDVACKILPAHFETLDTYTLGQLKYRIQEFKKIESECNRVLFIKREEDTTSK